MTISRLNVWASAVLVAAGLCVSFAAGRLSTPELGAPPALDLAREIGVAIPEVQLPAFSDGQITFQEVTDAVTRFRTCVVSAGHPTGWSATLEQDGSFTISVDDPDGDSLSRAMYTCRIEHLAATQSVYAASLGLADG